VTSYASTLTPVQVVAAMAAAGWPREQWATGAAIAMAESSDNDQATNPSGASGLFQILRSAHEDLFAALPTPEAWKDPVINAGMALKVWKGRGSKWDTGGWTTYGGSSYKAALPAATNAASQVAQQLEQAGSTQAQQQYLGNILRPVSPEIDGLIKFFQGVQTGIADVVGTTAQTEGDVMVSMGQQLANMTQEFASISDLFQKLLLPSTWLRIGAGITGGALVLFGIFILGREASQ